MNFLRLICLLIPLIGCQWASAQSRADVAVVKNALLPTPKQPEFDYTSTQQSKKLGQKVGAAAFYLQKKCIADQDMHRCHFTMSCAEYRLRAVQRHGLIAGMVMGTDRATRCHGLHHNFYPKDAQRLRSVDPVAQ